MLNLKYIGMLILLSATLFGAKLTALEWNKGESFSEYLHSKGISLSVLDHISTKDLSFVLDIHAQQTFYELKNDKGKIEQILIPISQEMQIHLAKEHNFNHYNFEIITIKYEEEEYFATVEIKNNLPLDVKKTLKYPMLANKMGQLFKGTMDTTKFKKGDKVSFIYAQKMRLGQRYFGPSIKIALYEHADKKQFIYADEDGYGYTSSATSKAYTVKNKKKITYTRRVGGGDYFSMPLRHIRITSSFAYKRYHPILKRYRPHHGTDFGAKRGTPLLAVNDGKVSFSGRMGGYGNVVKIKHKGGYESLYAHQSKRRVKKGERVKRGQIIGYVGSTGRSTGPHLHFGLKKNGHWINPMRVLQKKPKKSILKTFTKYETVSTTKYKEISIKDAKKNKTKLLEYLKQKNKPFIWNQVIPLAMEGEKNNESNQTL